MNYISESFADIDELLRILDYRKINRVFSGGGTLASDKDDYEFTKTHSYAEAVDLFRNGYEDPLKKIKKGVEVNSRGFSTQKTLPKNDIIGYAPCVPNAILGIPQSMINKDVIARKSKVLTVVYDVTGAWHVDAETFIKAGIMILTIINSLEVNGYRVSLKVAFQNASQSDEKVFATVVLKDWRQPLDLKKMAFPFCHPSMLRRIGFRHLERNPKLTSRGFRHGYGTSDVSAKDYDELEKQLRDNKLITEHEKYINIKLCEKNDFDPQEVAKACGLK